MNPTIRKRSLASLAPFAARALFVVLMLLWVALAGSALAQPAPAAPGLVDLSGVRAQADVPNDLASWIFNNLFGPIFANPFTSVGGATTLFGVVFLAFNVVVFSAGVVWATYGVAAGVVQSAHEGTVLGKRMSAIWMPIRMVTGIGSLVPAFGGFSLSQAVMIFAAGWGIVFGNYAYIKALEAASNFTPLVSLSISSGPQVKTTEHLAKAIFEQELCVIDAEVYQQEYQGAGNSVPESDRVQPQAEQFVRAAGSDRGWGIAYGTRNDPARCGAVGIVKINGDTRGGLSLFGFRNSNVDYAAIAQGVYGRYQANYASFDGEVRRLAREWARQVQTAAANQDAPTVALPMEALKAQAIAYAAAAALPPEDGSARGQALKDAAFQNMRQFGFLGAGAFYSTLAELNSAIGQATRAVDFVIRGPSLAADEADAQASESRTRFRKAYLKQIQTPAGMEDRPLLGASEVSCSAQSLFASTNCSVGQMLVQWILRGMTAGSSVGGSGEFRIIDPIIAAKNLGDYLMMSSEAAWAFANATGIADNKPGGAASVASTIASKALDFAKNIPVVGPLMSGIAKGIGAMLPLLIGLAFGLGLLLAIYIPMVPFINWVSAIVQYVSTVTEAMAAAPLWSFAHLQSDGEGMGQRTERGYIYLLLMLFTPILMVIGFFAACGLVVLTGTAVLWLFLPAMANAQGNSITGIVSILAYIFIFFLLMNILIQGLFNLTMDLKDDVIGWIGNVGRSQIGRDTESKASGLFVAGGRVASHGVQGGMGKDLLEKQRRAAESDGAGSRGAGGRGSQPA